MRRAREVDRYIGGQLHARGVDRLIATLAEGQHGVVSRAQLLDVGLGRCAVDHRVAAGRLHVLNRGVYAVGHRILSREGRWMAALLTVGADAVLSHCSAAAFWGIRETSRARVDVTVPRALPQRAGIQVHRARLASDEVTTHRGIPVTTPPRTLLDLAAEVPRHQLERAIGEAEIRRLTDPLTLDDVLERYPRRKGARALRAVRESARAGLAVTRSELEARFLAFLDGAVLPRPETNVRIELGEGAFEVDCLWRQQRLIVELDGQATHATTAAFERDRARDRILQAHGHRVIRITWRQLHTEADRLAADLTRLLR